MNFENKRQLKRRKLRDEISVSIQRSGSLISGVLLDMTSMGMLILADERLEAFVPIKISIELPIDFCLYFTDISNGNALKFQLVIQYISIGISMQFQLDIERISIGISFKFL